MLVLATTHLPTEQLDKLAPWPLTEAAAYHGDYLAGYQALRYDTEPEAGLTEAKARMAPVIEGTAGRTSAVTAAVSPWTPRTPTCRTS
ncbi:hypothetical protein V2I01_26485 [Micromonospora sp. BRA006-A]|nr:hypothetical protein [Micromonospora sp. BRA006-A]